MHRELVVKVYFNKVFFCPGDGDVDEVAFLSEHPRLSGVARWHVEVAAKEVDSGPLETFGFVNGGEG